MYMCVNVLFDWFQHKILAAFIHLLIGINKISLLLLLLLLFLLFCCYYYYSKKLLLISKLIVKYINLN